MTRFQTQNNWSHTHTQIHPQPPTPAPQNKFSLLLPPLTKLVPPPLFFAFPSRGEGGWGGDKCSSQILKGRNEEIKRRKKRIYFPYCWRRRGVLLMQITPPPSLIHQHVPVPPVHRAPYPSRTQRPPPLPYTEPPPLSPLH